MALTSLLVCADSDAIGVIRQILQDLAIDVESCADVELARARLSTQPYDAVLVDCKDEPPAMELIKTARKLPLNRTTLVIAIVSGQNRVREVFANGANFILYKPISAERATNSLRAARGLMRRERRRSPRIAVHTSTAIAFGATENAPATLLELSEEGISIQSEQRLPPHCKVYFQFALPGHPSEIRLSGETVWQDSTGRIGIRFADVPRASRKLLNDWLHANVAEGAQKKAEAAEAEAQAAAQKPSAPVGMGLLAASAGDRRGRSRRACRLSADVYRMGLQVPNRCQLSDISNGGCYVEMPSPFPAGTSVEIIVRTSTLKFRVRGRVQAAHPGFGMGVAFSLQTLEEREQVQQLVQMHSAESGLNADSKVF